MSNSKNIRVNRPLYCETCERVERFVLVLKDYNIKKDSIYRCDSCHSQEVINAEGLCERLN